MSDIRKLDLSKLVPGSMTDDAVAKFVTKFPYACAAPPEYSTDMNAVWPVVEATGLLEDGGNNLELWQGTLGDWVVADSDLATHAHAPTAPMALCLAMLKRAQEAAEEKETPGPDCDCEGMVAENEQLWADKEAQLAEIKKLRAQRDAAWTGKITCAWCHKLIESQDQATHWKTCETHPGHEEIQQLLELQDAARECGEARQATDTPGVGPAWTRACNRHVDAWRRLRDLCDEAAEPPQVGDTIYVDGHGRVAHVNRGDGRGPNTENRFFDERRGQWMEAVEELMTRPFFCADCCYHGEECRRTPPAPSCLPHHRSDKTSVYFRVAAEQGGV